MNEEKIPYDERGNSPLNRRKRSKGGVSSRAPGLFGIFIGRPFGGII
jgi:hypothetical protein